MNDTQENSLMHRSLADRDFRRLSEFIQSSYGIKMPVTKKIMLEARLRKRLRALNMESFSEYCDYVFSPDGRQAELTQMINVITTNKTDFFREPAHFDYLFNTGLPEFLERYRGGARKRFMVWSAGCSTGEEPYSIAMLLSEFREVEPDFDYEILATDLSTNVLERAKTGIYRAQVVEPVPMEFKKKYLLKSRDPAKQVIRVVPALRSKVHFRQLNFMEGDFGMRELMDAVFCRNVIIYFERPTQEILIRRLCGHLKTHGILLLGHSETLHGMDLPLRQVAPTIYRKI